MPGVKKQEMLFIALCAGTIAFAIAFVYPVVTAQAIAWYYPLEHRWGYEVKPAGLAMDFYGRTAQAAIAWAIGFLAGLAIVRRKRSLGPRTIALFTAWTATAILGVMLYYGWTLIRRAPVPAPIPSWYQPR